jgi:hypothetical protein
MEANHPERPRRADHGTGAGDAMILYGAFPNVGIEQLSRAIAAVGALYPSFRQIVASSSIKLFAGDAAATMVRIKLRPTPAVNANRSGIGFVVAEETPENVALCWDGLQAVLLEYPCDVWISSHLYDSSAIQHAAVVRPLALEGGEDGHLLTAEEFDTLVRA